MTPKVLELYRERHRIVPVRDLDEDLGRMVGVCDHDGIRVYMRADGRFVHDVSRIRELARLERGKGVAW